MTEETKGTVKAVALIIGLALVVPWLFAVLVLYMGFILRAFGLQ